MKFNCPHADLQKSVNKAFTIFKFMGCAKVSWLEISCLLGFTAPSGAENSKINSLRKYGLLYATTDGRTFVLSELALRIFREKPSAEQFYADLSEAAFLPEMFSFFRTQFGETLPMDKKSIRDFCESQGYGKFIAPTAANNYYKNIVLLNRAKSQFADTVDRFKLLIL